MPNEDHPLYPRLERAARQVFERFSANGWLESRGATELCIGKIVCAQYTSGTKV